jgi:hypothetical protein
LFGGILLALIVFVQDIEAAPRKRVNRNANRPAAARERALAQAIQSTRGRLEAAERALAAVSRDAQKKQGEALQSGQRAESAKQEAAESKLAASNAHLALKELQANIEREQPADSPFRRAKAAYEAAVDDLAEERLEIYESLDYQAKYARADKAPNRLDEIEKVTQAFFAGDEEYQAALREAEATKSQYDKERLAIYKAHPQWAALVKDARATYGAQAKAENAFDAAAVDRGLDNINRRGAGQRLAVAQAAVNDARADLQRLQNRKKKEGGQPNSTGKKPAQKKR